MNQLMMYGATAAVASSSSVGQYTETAVTGRQKRLRHLTTLHAKNLKINSTRFSVWFTLHQRTDSRAFFVSEKKENERNPKWNLKENALAKYATKEFVLRLWFTNLDLKKTSSSDNNNNSLLLNLLLEMHVNMDYLYLLSEQNLNSVTKQTKSYANFLIFEVFGMNYSEFFVLKRRTNTQSAVAVATVSSVSSVAVFKPPTSSRVKKSYTLNSMIRIHDYQRVIQDTLVKIAQQKANSLNKFEQLSRVRQMQAKREESRQRIGIYRDTLRNLGQSMYNLQQINLTLEERNRFLRDQLASIDNKDQQRRRVAKMEQICDHSARALGLILSQLKLRQYEMVLQISDIFPITVDGDLAARILGSTLIINKSNMYYVSSPNSLGAGGNVTLAPASKENESSVSLGYIVQCALLLADVFCTPLPYPLLFRGSESYIIEQVDETDSRKLPLHKSSNASDEIFHYGISLLNADLLQLKAHADRRFLRQFLTGGASHHHTSRDLLLNLKEIFDHFGGLMR